MLVDTSVWIDHFRRGNAVLAERLNRGEVRSHPFVTGELSCGNLRRRKESLSLLAALHQAMLAGHEEALAFVGATRVRGRGCGGVAALPPAPARLTGIPLGTLDRRLKEVAGSLGLGPTIPTGLRTRSSRERVRKRNPSAEHSARRRPGS